MGLGQGAALGVEEETRWEWRRQIHQPPHRIWPWGGQRGEEDVLDSAAGRAAWGGVPCRGEGQRHRMRPPPHRIRCREGGPCGRG